jgi:energy-coupling factor transporter ATP-binding protein EcfA2
VDVGAKDEIHRIIFGLADDGVAVLVVSADLPEVQQLADRVLVVRGGQDHRGVPEGHCSRRAARRGGRRRRRDRGAERLMAAALTDVTAVAQRRRPVARAVEGQELALVGVIVLLWAALSIGTDTFLTSSNISNLLYSVSAIALVGIGMTAVIVTGGIDVSVGSSAAVVMVLVAKLIRDSGAGLVQAVLTALVIGVALGALNGALIAYGASTRSSRPSAH